jgi:hypothetical protein
MSTEQDAPPQYGPEQYARVAGLVRRWVRTIAAAASSVGQAQIILAELEDCDEELAGGTPADDATRALREAWRQLNFAVDVARDRLRLVEYAEKDTELDRLRAEVAELRQQRAVAAIDFTSDSRLPLAPCLRPAWHGMCGPNPAPVNCQIAEHHAPDQADAVLAEDAARYHGFVRALDGTLRFCAFAPGHEPGCRDSDGHVIITVAGPNAPCRCAHPARAHNALISSGSRTYCNECDPGMCTRYEAAEADGATRPHRRGRV